MHIATFLQDLAVIMIVAGIVTVIFHRLKQPVVLGYILSGVILGQHTPPFSFIHDENTVKTLAELGIIFLMFSLGLEFSIRKLFRVGAAALVAALSEIILMILVGYEMGQFFGWKPIDSLFLGAMLSISSTTIIIKALNELRMKRENFAQLIFGILIIEDILAIGILAIFSGIAINGSFNVGDLITTLGKLLVFLVVSLVVGIFLVPKLLAYVARFNNKEMLLVVVLGLCFGFSLLVIKLGYSIAIGAFLIGAIMAESQEIKLIEKLIEPLTNMFSAIFFVSIGLLVDPTVMTVYIVPIIVITAALVIGKVLVCSLGVFLAGRDARTSMRVGMGLAQIGEFSFIIASLGISLKVMSPYLYPIIVAVSAITTFLTPYLIRAADPFTGFLAAIIPSRISQIFNTYTAWLQNIRIRDEQMLVKQAIKKGLLQIFINLILIIGIFMGGAYLSHDMKFHKFLFEDRRIENAMIWGSALIISLPFLIAIYVKLKGLSMIIAEIAVKAKESGEYNIKLRRTISEVIPVAGMLGIILMIVALSASILPPMGLLLFVLFIVIILAAVLWHWFITLHSRLQIAFMDTFNKKKHKP
jgi:CPA2 family monovalent cation:H+ antiporter-2